MLFKNRTSDPAWIVVFLGNPGSKYAGTRHNVGFMTGDRTENKLGIRINRIKFKSLTCLCDAFGERVLFMKPQTYMNLSGDAVSQAAGFYKIPLDRIIVVSDDVAMPVGKLRIRRKGSAGGHNGLKDIIAKCGGDNFIRLKIGVGEKPHPDYDMADWVLSAFKNQDADAISRATETAVSAIETIITQGVEKAMSLYN